MANGFVNRLQGLLSGQNTLGNLGLGLLAFSGPSAQPRSFGQVLAGGAQFASDRQRQAMENEAMRQELLASKRQQAALQGIPGLLSQQTHVPVSAPIGLMNVEGGMDMIDATRRQAVPTVSTPQGKQQLFELMMQANPQAATDILAQRLLGPASQREFKTDTGKLFADLDLAEAQGNTQAAAALRSAIETQLQGETVNFDDLRAARNDVIKNSQEFLGAKSGFERVQVAATGASPASDIALVFGFMKTIDPTSVVREGEQATAASAGSVPQRIWGLYNRILTGERLTPDQRLDFLTQARAQFAERVEQQQQVIEDAQGFAERNNLPMNDVVPEFLIPELPELPTVEGAGEPNPFEEAARGAVETGRKAVVRVADIARMGLEKLNALDPAQMSQEALEAAARRFEELNGG